MNSGHTQLNACCFVFFHFIFLNILAWPCTIQDKQKCFNLSTLISLQSLTIGFGCRYTFFTQTQQVKSSLQLVYLSRQFSEIHIKSPSFWHGRSLRGTDEQRRKINLQVTRRGTCG